MPGRLQRTCSRQKSLGLLGFGRFSRRVLGIYWATVIWKIRNDRARSRQPLSTASVRAFLFGRFALLLPNLDDSSRVDYIIHLVKPIDPYPSASLHPFTHPPPSPHSSDTERRPACCASVIPRRRCTGFISRVCRAALGSVVCYLCLPAVCCVHIDALPALEPCPGRPLRPPLALGLRGRRCSATQ